MPELPDIENHRSALAARVLERGEVAAPFQSRTSTTCEARAYNSRIRMFRNQA